MSRPSLLTLLFLVLLVLPSPAQETASLKKALGEAHQRFRRIDTGKNADYIPYLAGVDRNLFGLAAVTVKGEVLTVGDTDHPFAIESISKVFTLALAMSQLGPEKIAERIGVEPTGLPFNSVMAVELEDNHTVNPLVNAGAISTVSLLQTGGADRFTILDNFYDKLAGEPLNVLEDVYVSESETNTRNRGLANLLLSYDRLYCPVDEALDVYTRQCSVGVTTRQLAMMGAVLANGGVQPVTGERLIAADHVPKILSVMQMSGFYDGSGRWAYETGLPGKTGVGGGIVVIVPGKVALAAFSPPLDEQGNSVRGQLALQYVAQTMGYNIFR